MHAAQQAIGLKTGAHLVFTSVFWMMYCSLFLSGDIAEPSPLLVLLAPWQVWAFILMAVVGGYIGSLFTSFNTWVCLLRKKWSTWFSFRVLEVGHLEVPANHTCSHLSPPVQNALTGQTRQVMPWAGVHASLHGLTLCIPAAAVAALPPQVCVLSIITSILFFALPLAGRCHKCDTQDPTHCVKGVLNHAQRQ
jgi:hypothetical protein